MPLDEETIEAIRTMREKGDTLEAIVNEVGVAINTVRAYTKDIVPPKISSVHSRQTARRVHPVTGAQQKVLDTLRDDIVNEAVGKTEESLAVGKAVIDEWKERAELRNIPLVDYINHCITFTNAYEGVIDDMQAELKALDGQIKMLREYANPAIVREKNVKRYLMHCYVNKYKPSEEALREILTEV